jgi:ParB-like chromosome segregation protein Spo0J
MSNKIGIDNQPLNSVQWVDRSTLFSNNYNPNHVAPTEMKLLKISIMEDGWTQPIVALQSGEIVDGFHRWTVSDSQELREMTNGLVPVVFINPDKDQQMMATIRHNRARGSHGVLKMAEIVRDLVDKEGLTFQQVMGRLQMEEEEVDRLYDAGGMTVRASKEGFNKGWVPKELKEKEKSKF